MPEVLLFIKDFELGSRLSAACVDKEKNVEFSDENSDSDSFPDSAKLAIVDMDEQVFSSVGLVAALKRKGLKVIGTMKKINNREQAKLQSAGCDLIIPRSSLVKNMPNMLDEFLE